MRTRPSASSMMLAGLRSRWRTPRSCAAARTAQIGADLGGPFPGEAHCAQQQRQSRIDQLHGKGRPAVVLADVLRGRRCGGNLARDEHSWWNWASRCGYPATAAAEFSRALASAGPTPVACPCRRADKRGFGSVGQKARRRALMAPLGQTMPDSRRAAAARPRRAEGAMAALTKAGSGARFSREARKSGFSRVGMSQMFDISGAARLLCHEKLPAQRQLAHHVFFRSEPESIADRDALIDGVRASREPADRELARRRAVRASRGRWSTAATACRTDLIRTASTTRHYQSHPLQQPSSPALAAVGKVWATRQRR